MDEILMNAPSPFLRGVYWAPRPGPRGRTSTDRSLSSSQVEKMLVSGRATARVSDHGIDTDESGGRSLNVHARPETVSAKQHRPYIATKLVEQYMSWS